VFRGFNLRLNFTGSSAISGNQTVEIVAIGSVGTEGLLIEQTLDTATQANLI